MDDMPSLPFVSAIVKECLRWRNVVPLNVPHVTTEDDVYKGYHIPKGAMVITNLVYVRCHPLKPAILTTSLQVVLPRPSRLP